MSHHLAFPRPLSWDHDYWLCRCRGFRVDSPAGCIGRVEDVRFGSRLDRPDLLLVRSGLLAKRLLSVPVSEVEQVVPLQLRLSLRSAPPHTQGRRWFARLREHVVATLGVR
jgi:hypothetical protein